MATTDRSYWETLTKEELIEAVMQIDDELDNTLCENATLRDEITELENRVELLTGE